MKIKLRLWVILVQTLLFIEETISMGDKYLRGFNERDVVEVQENWVQNDKFS
jgi:hypothetical protein